LQKIREECLRKGDITHAVVEFHKYDITPMTGARDRMLDDYIHCIDTARWICGGEVVRIESKCKSILVPDINWIGAALHFDNGSICYTVGNWSSGRRVFRVQMHGQGICAEAEPEKEGYLYANGDEAGIRYDSKTIAGSDELFVYGGFQKKNREFIDSILSGIDVTSSPFRDALKTMNICETILAQNTLAQ
jgi:predicted dehydrogenase